MGRPEAVQRNSKNSLKRVEPIIGLQPAADHWRLPESQFGGLISHRIALNMRGVVIWPQAIRKSSIASHSRRLAKKNLNV